jgi:putative nucleotidyltransferase with HDIG domain
MKAIEDIINRIEYLPPIPHSIANVLEVLNRAEVPFDEIHKSIQYDPVLSANILKLCNSAFFARRRKISELREAINLLGLAELKSTVLFLAAQGVFKRESKGYEAHKGELLRHAIASAVIARQLKPFMPETFTDLFTTALLHDVGKLILHEFVSEARAEIESCMMENGVSFEEAELKVIGFTHAEVGAIILARWMFPDDMVRAVRFHHHPDQVPDSPLTHFTALADIIAMLMGYSTGNDGLAYHGYASLYGAYGLSEPVIERIIMLCTDQIEEIVRLLP